MQKSMRILRSSALPGWDSSTGTQRMRLMERLKGRSSPVGGKDFSMPRSLVVPDLLTSTFASSQPVTCASASSFG